MRLKDLPQKISNIFWKPLLKIRIKDIILNILHDSDDDNIMLYHTKYDDGKPIAELTTFGHKFPFRDGNLFVLECMKEMKDSVIETTRKIEKGWDDSLEWVYFKRLTIYGDKIIGDGGFWGILKKRIFDILIGSLIGLGVGIFIGLIF